jgi:predicted TIM-barrel fold metal-dependent hydrolase
MRLDIHAHVSAFNGVKSVSYDRNLLGVEEQIRLMDMQGIDKAVILPMGYAECPYESQSIGEILYICEQYPGRFIPFCNIDPRLPMRPDLVEAKHFVKQLSRYKELGCKGVGELFARLPWDHPLMLHLLEACETVGFPVLFHTITEDCDSYGVIDGIGLPKLEYVLQRYPALKMIGHSAAFWSEISGGISGLNEKNGYPSAPVKHGGKIPQLLRKYPNLYCDLSAGSGINALRRDTKHAFEFIKEFQDRLMFGTDNYSIDDPMPHADWFDSVRVNGDITADVYDKIMCRNANGILDLGI